MRIRIIRKLLLIIIVTAAVFTNTDCKKQPKCGCDGDALFTLDRMQATVYYNESGTTIYFMPVDNPYETYNFCNPEEMFPKLADSKSGDILLVSGPVFWNCNYAYQSSNYYYQSYQKVYDIKVTDVFSDLYGKKPGDNTSIQKIN